MRRRLFLLIIVILSVSPLLTFAADKGYPPILAKTPASLKNNIFSNQFLFPQHFRSDTFRSAKTDRLIETPVVKAFNFVSIASQTNDNSSTEAVHSPGIVSRWVVPVGVTLGVGLLIYTVYSVRGR